MSQFNKLGLSQSTLEALGQLGFEVPTPIQEQAIPLLLGNNPTDFIGLAQTGTGKTAAFGLPLIDLIDLENNATQALIMAPTRELGQQTAKQLVDFAKGNKALNVEVVYGGAAISNQIKALRKPTHIVVATPGRLLDLIKRKAVRLDNVSYVVLDEADEMLNMGFKEDIDQILSHTLDERVTWLFSATMPSDIRKIINKYMESPLEVSINTQEKINKDISHKYVVTTNANKIPALKRFLEQQPDMKGIMFCRTRRETKKISDDLGKLGYNVEALHGDLSQGQRDAAMGRFKNRKVQLLIATDVAARGIDVDDLTHVIHHTLPDQLESYTHRSGRTGRIGKKGISLAFINNREGRRINELERKIKVEFERIDVPSAEGLRNNRINSWAHQIINTPVDRKADEILNELNEQFAPLSKEDILRRLITAQLAELTPKNGERADLNEKTKEPSSHGKHNKREQKHEGKHEILGYNRYFINIGSVDGVTKGDLLHMLSEVSGIKRKCFGQMSLQKNCTYFDVDDRKDKGLSESFWDMEIEGRPIRVNRDNEGKARSKPAFKKNKGKYKKAKPGNRHSKKRKR